MSGRGFNTVGLFAGIGGFELGLQKAGHHTSWMCEIDPAARAVLRRRFPGVEIKEDIRSVSRLPRGTDLLAAGFPCQDLSQVGETRGLLGDKSMIVNQVFRILKQTRAHWILLENVPFMLRLHKGAAIRHITSELERLGYSWAYRTIDTRSFGLPQRRERVFLLAGLEEEPWKRLFNESVLPPLKRDSDIPPCGFYWTEGNRGIGWAPDAIPTLKGGSNWGIPSSPAIWLSDGSIVTPDLRDAERLQGFTANWTIDAESVSRPGHRWRLVGNAVTSKVSQWLGSAIADSEGGEPQLKDLSELAPWPSAAMGRKGQRFEVVSTTKWPVRKKVIPIDEFLHFEPKELSHRAALGFWTRLELSGLHYPPAFAKALKAHIRRAER
jgi:DNA (cytosine-5)-methyltransferase 1